MSPVSGAGEPQGWTQRDLSQEVSLPDGRVKRFGDLTADEHEAMARGFSNRTAGWHARADQEEAALRDAESRRSPGSRTPSSRLRAVLYLRMSLDRTGEGAGVERQETACRALADARGWDVVRVFTDNSVSASKGVRPQWEAMLTAASAGSFDLVVSWAMDRLVRRSSDLERLIETGVRAATVQGDLDLTTVQGELVGGILAGVARAEVRQKGERQRAANRQRAEAGQMGWTRRPFGYDRVDSKGQARVVTVPEEVEALQRAAKTVLNGATLAAAARQLDAEGHTTSTGGPWSVTSLRRTLLSPRYAGRSSYLGADVAAGEWPVVLDADTQERLAAVLREPRRRVQQGTELRYLLSGSARCGRCGERLYASPMGSGEQRRTVYKCRRDYLARRADLVDEVVVGVVLARLQQPDAVSLLTATEDVDALRRRVVDLRERRDAIASLVADGLLGPAAAREQAQGLTSRLQAAESDIERALGTSPAAALVSADDVTAAWQALTLRQQRAVVDELLVATVLPAGKGVRWSPEQVAIEWKASR